MILMIFHPKKVDTAFSTSPKALARRVLDRPNRGNFHELNNGESHADRMVAEHRERVAARLEGSESLDIWKARTSPKALARQVLDRPNRGIFHELNNGESHADRMVAEHRERLAARLEGETGDRPAKKTKE